MQKLTDFSQKYAYHIVGFGILLVYFCNLFIDVMDIDAAQYASISMEMAQTKSFLHVYHRGDDYLDKPPLLFWLSSVSMLFFGISNFTYKLPSVFIALLGIYSTYKFAQLFYNETVARYAALILASSQALFLITNDLRTDTNLLAFTIFSVWQLQCFLNTNKWKNLLLGFVGIGFAMLAKGPIGIVAVAIALGGNVLLKQQLKHIFKWQYLIGLVVVAIILAPMTYGLYTQFDLHPEKSAYGIESPSGVKFFYWTQSFGRITGESSWQNDSTFFYFFHTILWDFAPWILLFLPALMLRIYRLVTQFKTEVKQTEFVTLSGFLIVFLALSLSKYKLPHYVFITLPFAAVITSNFLVNELKYSKATTLIYRALNALFWLVAVLACYFVFTPEYWWVYGVLGVLFFGWTHWSRTTFDSWQQKLVLTTVLTAVGFNFYMASTFYPQLISNYQGSNVVARAAKSGSNQEKKLYLFANQQHSLDFYYGEILPALTANEVRDLETNSLIYTNQAGLDILKEREIPVQIQLATPDYNVTALKLKFLLKETRPTALDTVYLLEKI